MRIKFNKDLEFFFKRFFFSDKFLLKKRLERSIKNNYEDELKILDKIVDKNLESVDVGVYRGVYSYKLSKITAHVHSFEPNPLIFPYLNKNLKRISKNITLYDIALSDQTIETDLKIPERFKTLDTTNYEEKYKLGCATIHKKNILENNEFISCKVKTAKLDDILPNNKIGFIKIDVEGHEKNVLLGAKKILEKNRPNLLIEIEEKHTNDKVENIINFINDFGYKSYYSNNFELISTDKLKDHKLVNNYIFIHQ